MIGRRLAHYEVTALLGSGGMGEVYRARDTRLGRDVALKILPEDIAADADRLERFQREARALAALEHPNIVTIHAVEHAGAVHFLVMELVQGESLADLSGRGPMSLPRLLEIAVQLTGALHAAHERGVVHRDLKPANVMVTEDGRVKVLDFGLAKQAGTESHDGTTVLRTDPGVVMGTAAYMSPEQAQGHAVDHRSDIFSLGVVLHELAAGQRPFRGDNATLVLSAILRDEPTPVDRIEAGLPGALADVILRCLRKSPPERFQTAREVGDALRFVGTSSVGATASTSGKTVVVLPFVNRSPDPENEYFADGLTEEVIADLSRVSGMRVISRNSAMALKGTTKDTATLARELGVSHLVSGSVRRAGSALRVTAELVEASSDTPVWGEKYSGTVEDVFGIQEEISRKIVSSLEVTLTDSEARRVAARPIDNVVAYEGYLRARQEMYAWTPDALRRSDRLVDDALAIVGENALLLATKGQICWTRANAMMDLTGESLDQAADLASRALALDPACHLGVFVRGLVAGLRGEVERALEDLRAAHELVPGDANVMTELCRFANAAGLRHQDRLVAELHRVDPLSPLTPFVASTYYSVTGRFEEAAAAARRVIDMAPPASGLQMLPAWQVAEAGHVEEAAAVLSRVGEALRDTPLGSAALFLARALEGRTDEALAHAGPDLERAIRADHFVRMIAGGYARLGRRDDALRWVRLTIDRGFINYPCLAEHDPCLADLRTDTEFVRMMAELKPRWEAAVAREPNPR